MLAVSEKLRKAYWLKENFYRFMDSKDICEAKQNLKNWNLCAGVAQLEEFEKCFSIVNPPHDGCLTGMITGLQFLGCHKAA